MYIYYIANLYYHYLIKSGYYIMRVSPINNFAQQQNVKNEQPNFKGLWGNVEVETQKEIYTYDKTYEDVYLTITQEYYPFIDETREGKRNKN